MYLNKACVTYTELVGGCVISPTDYNNYVNRGKIIVVRKGGNGRHALIDYNSMPDEVKNKFRRVYGDDISKQALQSPLLKHFEVDIKAHDFFTTYRYENGLQMKPEKVAAYTANASALNAVIKLMEANRTMRKALGGKAAIGTIYKDFILPSLKAFKQEWGHTLPKSERQLREVINRYTTNSYAGLISGKDYNENAKKISENEQQALLRRLLGHANNFNHGQVVTMYNEIAKAQGWKPISRKGIEDFAAKNAVNTEAGRRGEVSFNNKMAMHVKRKGPGYPMLFWSIDGWDVELVFQQTTINKEGKSVTTYHNRPTVVIVLDPFTKYPIGYAIGTHETPLLIRDAVRNALNHTEELFNSRYRPNQIQSDRYSLKTLEPFFKAITPRYTPAKVRNAKAKPVEPYFNYLNTNYCQYLNNWSGHNADANKDNQPNEEFKNKIRHSFPDWNGVVLQVENFIQLERNKKRGEYLTGWEKLATDYKLPWNTEQYLYAAGERKDRSSKIRGGLSFDLKGIEYNYDTFDLGFRDNINNDWTVCFDPSNMDYVLAIANNGAERHLLTAKHIQPMTLVERTEGDAPALAQIESFNKQLKGQVLQQSTEDYAAITELFGSNPALNDTLAKMVIVDSMGQHKNQRNAHRAIETGRKMLEQETKTKAIDIQEPVNEVVAEREKYLEEKNNYDQYL